MITKPLLILAFNRPTHLKRLIDSLRPHAPQKILVSVDGPRVKNKHDPEKIAQVLAEIKKIDWTRDIEFRIRERNLGLRFAVADAVSWVIDKYGEVIVVEDDIEVGPEFLDFMSQMLDQYRNDKRIGHISGYNLVPPNELENPSMKIRLSLIPESYAWATWAQEWKKFDEGLNWARKQNVGSLRRLLGSYESSIVWRVNFNDAVRGNISTWAYRWISTLWSREKLCISPNRNLVTYNGNSEGTHTRTKVRYIELPIENVSKLTENSEPTLDASADQWLQKNVFRATWTGVLVRIGHSIALEVLKLLKR